MTRIVPVENVLYATINLGTNTTESTKTPKLWAKLWNERDVQIMVLISLALQLFLLLAGNVGRRHRVGWLRFLVWLAYLASYPVAASAIGLFSQYENKYKLRSRESVEHLHLLTMPFLWPPFLLFHLGGPDTITAFSLEDNNLWARQLINLVIQLSLALYVFWKSFDLLDSQLLKVAVPLFVAGTIKYGERIWALKRGSRESLDGPKNKDFVTAFDGIVDELIGILIKPPTPYGDVLASNALDSALCVKRLIAGRTLKQLGYGPAISCQGLFASTEPTEGKIKFVLTELGMLYDMLYTKAMVLQSWTGRVFRCVALVAMVVAFVLFWSNRHLRAHKTANAAITYTLFCAAIILEFYSIFRVIASPWTRARSKKDTLLCWLSPKLAHCFPSQGLSSPSMGQFSLTDYNWSKKSKPEFVISNISEALGLEQHRRNFWHIKHVEDKVIVDYIVGLFRTDPNSSGEHLELGRELKDLLNLPFEDTLFRLHTFTEIHLSTLAGGGNGYEMEVLVAECRKLSNYLMYLRAVCPSMLPVGVTAEDLEPIFTQWIQLCRDEFTKTEFLALDNTEWIGCSPFRETVSVASLKEIKEVWARLLIYAAGKCPMEQYARQLRNGLELLTVVGSVMMHHRLGDVGQKVELLAPAGFVSVPTQEPWPTEPVYIFEFFHDDHQMPTSLLPLSRMGGHVEENLNLDNIPGWQDMVLNAYMPQD